MISPRDIDTTVEVVGSRAVESSTWLERGRLHAQMGAQIRAFARRLKTTDLYLSSCLIYRCDSFCSRFYTISQP